MRTIRTVVAAATALALTSSLGGCGREAGQTVPTGSVEPRMINQFEGIQPIPPGLEPGSEDEWLALVDPAAVDLEDVALHLGLTIIGAEDYGDYVIVLFDDGGQDLGPGDFGQVGLVLGVPNDLVDLAEGGSLVIGFIGGEWTLPGASAQVGFEALNLQAVHAVATGAGTKIGVVDTGARLDHVAFAGNLEILVDHRLTSGELEGDGIDNDNDELIDEGLGHGTLVAGIAAMVAPDADILPVKVLNDDGVGSMLGVISGMLVCRDRGCDVLNLSIVLSDYHQAFEGLLQILADDGIVVTCAAGNNGPAMPRYPASSQHSVGVAAVDQNDVMAPYSGAGPLILIAAPGHRVVGAGIQGTRSLSGASGTSMAAPAVAGAIAVVREAMGCPTVTAMDNLAGRSDAVRPAGAVATGRVAPIRALGISGP